MKKILYVLVVAASAVSASEPPIRKDIPFVTESQFAKIMSKAQGPVVMKFTATWCGPCRQLEPVLEELHAKYGGRVTFVQVDVDQCPRLAAEYGVAAVPTTIVRDDKQLARVVGAHSKDTYAPHIEWFLTIPPSPTIASNQ